MAHISPLGSSFVISRDAELGNALSAQRVGELLSIYRNLTGNLRWNGIMCFLCLYILLPASFYFPNRSAYTSHIVAVTGLFYMFLCGVTYYYLHKRLYRDELIERWKGTILSLSLPWTAIRASDELLKNVLYQRVSYLSILAYQYQAGDKEPLRRMSREIKYLKKSVSLANRFTTVIRRSGIEVEDLLNQPVSGGPDQKLFCPCCHSSYSDGVTICSDCREVELVSFQQ